MSQFKLSFKLEQQTPMIHFQHNQSGACLRGSEVKPKLDRFLVYQIGRELEGNRCKNGKSSRDYDYDEDIFKKGIEKAYKEGWLISKNKPKLDGTDKIALDYKISFIAGEKVVKSDTIGQEISKIRNSNFKKDRSLEINGMYFGNMKGKDENKIRAEYKETVLYTEPIQGTIISFKTILLKMIKEHLPAFFLLHNFGTRQNKGFGSFKLVPDDTFEKYDIQDIIKRYTPHAFYIDYRAVDKEVRKNGNYKYLKGGWEEKSRQRLEDINMIYMLIKGGINRKSYIRNGQRKENNNNLYYKGFIFRYYLKKNKEWKNEKRFMKEKLENSNIKHHVEYVYVRGVLGITDNYKVVKQDKDNYIIQNVRVLNTEIERCPSPLTFKVVDEFLFVFPHRLPEELLENPLFTFQLESPKNDYKDEEDTISIPIDFNCKDFLKEFADDFNYKDFSRDPENYSSNKIVTSEEKKMRYKITSDAMKEFIRLEHAVLNPIQESKGEQK